jgi:hypothetical protein
VLFAAFAAEAHAQGARKDDVVFNSAGQPVGGANVAVCNSTATIGTSSTPCSPLATIYTDATLTTPAANPFNADGLGNYGFWAPPGTYQVQVYGPQITTTMKTVVLPCVPNSNCAGGGTNSPSAAVKPASSDAIQYVSPNGNDSNDGLSMGTAKATILAAYNALPGTGGTIYVSGNGAQCTPTAGQGIGFAASTDSDYGAMPEVLNNVYWVKAKSGAVAIQGVAADTAIANTLTGWTTVANCGSSSAYGLWLSGVSSVTISRLRIVSQGIRVGIDSSGSRTNNSNSTTDIELDHDSFRVDCATCGPTLDIGGNTIWLSTDFSTFENNAQAYGVSGGANQSANIYISSGGAGGAASGLLYFNQNFFTGGGGLRYDATSSGTGSVYAAHTLMEGASQCQPVYEVVSSGYAYAATFDLQGGASDCGANAPFVKVALGNLPCATSVRGINQSWQSPALEGPLTIGDAVCPGNAPQAGVSVSDGGIPSSGVIPAAKNQSGTLYGLSQHADALRRSFAPSFVRFANLAPQNPSAWVSDNGTGTTLTQIQGPGDPSGATDAATLNCTGNGVQGGCNYYAYNGNLTFAPGEYLYIGTWVQAATPAGLATSVNPFAGAPIGLEFVSNAPTIRYIAGGPVPGGTPFGDLGTESFAQNDGNWQWVWALAKVTAPSGSASQVKVTLSYQTGYPVNIYAPMFVVIPASSVALAPGPAFSSASESGNIVTVTTSAAHNLHSGNVVVISGCSISGYNGEFSLGNTITSTTFMLYNPATGLGSPTGCLITPENDSEVTDWANNLASYSDKCAAGVLCGVISNPPISTSALDNVILVDGVKYATPQAAINAAALGGTVRVPPGIWAQGATPLTITGVNLICERGAVITFNALGSSTDAVTVQGWSGSANYPLTVSGCTFITSASGSASGRDLIQISGGNHIVLRDLVLLDPGRDTIHVEPDASFHWIENLTLDNIQSNTCSSAFYGCTGTVSASSNLRDDLNISLGDKFSSSLTSVFVNEVTVNKLNLRAHARYGEHWYVNNSCAGCTLGEYLLSDTHSDGRGLVSAATPDVYFEKGASGGSNAIYGITYAGGDSEDTVTSRSAPVFKASGLNVGVGLFAANWTYSNFSTFFDSNFPADFSNAVFVWHASGNAITTLPQQFWKDGTPSIAASVGMFCPGGSPTSNLSLCYFNGSAWSPIQTFSGNLLNSAAAPTISSGFGTSPGIVQQNGTAAFEVNVGTGGAATSGVIGLPAAKNGWSCQATDMNTNIVTRETAFTTTSVTLTAASAWTASDKLLVNCSGF